MDMLKILDIHTYYGDSYVLQGITLEIAKGTVVALLGRNGVGKTTLIRSIVGFTPARRGQIRFNDRDITHLAAYKIIQLRMGLVPQGRRIFPSLSVKENLSIATRGSDVQGWDFSKIYGLFPRLEERRNQRGSTLSGGEQQMLAIARALISNPLFLLMDEPTEGLAPVLVREVGDVILRLKRGGLSIFLVEQNLSFAKKFADYTHVMSKGKIVHSSTPAELWENREVKERYLGV
jgi:branched-chain amino acid transport system ATP-binding protein